MDSKLYSYETDCEKKMNPFDYINAISYTKNNLVHDTDNDELAESGYNPFLTNKGLSYYPDTILYSNEMNTKSQLDNAPQFDYLINSIRPKKRFSKWHKKTTDDELMMMALVVTMTMMTMMMMMMTMTMTMTMDVLLVMIL